MVYPFSLQQVTLTLGIFYVLSHGFALLKPEACRNFLAQLPRNYNLGAVLMVGATLWFAGVLWKIDLMEYTKFRNLFILIVLAGGGAATWFLPDHLSGRALGSLLMLFAYLMLDAAFLNNQPLKLVVVSTAYVYIIAGMFLAASPYLLRDGIQFIYKTHQRAKAAAAAGAVFGLILCALALAVF